MIAALITALSVPGVALAAWLMKPLPLRARDLPVEPELEGAEFGLDYRGLV